MFKFVANYRTKKRLISEAISVLQVIVWHHSAILEAVETGSSTLVPPALPRTSSAFELLFVSDLLEDMIEAFE